MFEKDADFDQSLDAPGWVPADLDHVEPGSALAAMLDDIDINQCAGFDRIRVLRAHERMRAHYAARSYRAMSAVFETYRNDPDEAEHAQEAASVEVAAALRLTRRGADNEVGLAIDLRQRLPRVWIALCDGRIDVRRARIMVDGTLQLSTARAREVVDVIVGDAAMLTTGQLRAKLRRLCIQVDPTYARERYRNAVSDRRVVAEAGVDGTAELRALSLPPHRLQAAMRRVNKLALDLKHAGDTRTMDQLRADVLLDLIEGHGPASSRGTVHLTTDLATLSRLAEHPGELAGYGPVIADIARQVTEHQINSEWRWSLTDPETKMPIDGGITRRRPTAAQQRKTEITTPACVHPGCRMPAIESDIDHRIPWAETHRTKSEDLAPLCRYHHRIRHQHGWTYKPTAAGDFVFTSPLGHTHTTSGRDP